MLGTACDLLRCQLMRSPSLLEERGLRGFSGLKDAGRQEEGRREAGG
jgi:hypothetical protein